MRREAVDDPSRRNVIVKFPYIVFRWYTHHERVLSSLPHSLYGSRQQDAVTGILT
jgi:hypothetical protein